MIKSSAAIAGPLWRAFMNEILKTVPVERFEEPEIYRGTAGAPMIRGLWQRWRRVCNRYHFTKLATELTPEETRQEKVITNVHSILHWVQKKFSRTNPRQSSI